MIHYRWDFLPPAPDEYLAATSDFPRLIAQVLYNRGITEPSQLEPFLTADRQQLCNPLLLPDMQQAVSRIYQALLSGESIAIYGDFDVDGITATAILIQGLTALGGNAIPYIPHRITEGYGLKIAALENLYRQGISLIITVDCGITALFEVKKANKMGLDIIITDHHSPLFEIPPALAIVNPKLPGSKYPFAHLAGAGIAFKLAQALLQSIGRQEYLDQLIDLAALGTIADIVPLLGENRYLVKRGLMLINNMPRLGIREMINETGLNIGNLDTTSISWILAPRLNAAGRLAHAMTSYKLLMTNSPQEARDLVIQLEQKNAERQKLTSRTLAHAREQILAQGVSSLLIAADNDYPIGIVGLVAGRLAEEFYRPTVIIRTGEHVSSGSCRSIPEFNIIQSLNRCHHLFTRFGGHSQAAAFTLPTKNLPQLKEHLCQQASSQLDGIDLQPHLDIDAVINLSELSRDTFPLIQRLAPFGSCNPNPTLLSRRVEVLDCRSMGSNNGHLRLKLKQGSTVWDGVGFRLGNYRSKITSLLDIVYNLEMNNWRGIDKLRLNILDFKSTDPIL